MYLWIQIFGGPAAARPAGRPTIPTLQKGRQDREKSNVYRQINENDYIYVSYFNVSEKSGSNFTLEHFEDKKMTYKIAASRIKFNEKDSTYSLFNYTKRSVGVDNDSIERKKRLDTVFSFDIDDLTPVKYIAETLNLPELNNFIASEKRKGSSFV